VRLLIEKGAKINHQTEDGYSALMFAAGLMHVIGKGHLEMARLLIEKESKLNLQDKNGNTALMHAVMNNNLEIVRLLIEKGAKLNLQNKDGKTALMEGPRVGDWLLMSKLLIDAMLKPTKEQVDSIIALLGVSKKRQSEQLNLTGRDVVKLIGRERLNAFKRQNRLDIQEQIMKIECPSLRKKLLDYLNSIKEK
jgi:hypothetical protein